MTNPSAVIANRAMGIDMLTERLVAESDALDAEQAKVMAEEEAAMASAGSRRRRRHRRSGVIASMLDGSSVMDEESTELDLSAYDDLESGVERERRLAREWLMSGGEEDLNDNGIADEREREHEESSAAVRARKKNIFRRMIEEAEEDWDELGNKPLPGSKQSKEEADAADAADGDKYDGFTGDKGHGDDPDAESVEGDGRTEAADDPNAEK